MNRFTATASAFIFAAAMAGSAQAAVLMGAETGGTAFNGGGIFQIIAPPPAVGFDIFDDNNLRAFNEVKNLKLTSNLAVNTLAPSGPGNILAGTIVSSHLIVFDPIGTQTNGITRSVSGYVTFDAPILGAIWRDSTLTTTNALLGAPGTNYLTPPAVGLEKGADYFSIGTGVNANRLIINLLTASSPGDEIRVITGASRDPVSAVPEPATWLSMIVGFGVIGTFVRRRRRKVVTQLSRSF